MQAAKKFKTQYDKTIKIVVAGKAVSQAHPLWLDAQ
jgi:hypothetical protein